jgi:hypothetical protein
MSNLAAPTLHSSLYLAVLADSMAHMYLHQPAQQHLRHQHSLRLADRRHSSGV